MHQSAYAKRSAFRSEMRAGSSGSSGLAELRKEWSEEKGAGLDVSIIVLIYARGGKCKKAVLLHRESCRGEEDRKGH